MDTELMDQQHGPPLPASRREQRRVRRWLEEAWRHGEIVADDDGLLPEDAEEPLLVATPFRPSHAREPEDWPNTN